MEVNLDSYFRNIRMFYQQLIKGNKREEQLTQLFKKMLEAEARKWKRHYSFRGETARGPEGAGLLAKLKDQQKASKDKQKIQVDVLFASSKVQNMVVFGYCYLLL